MVTVKTVEEITEQYNFFHWHIQFPHVFAKGGFDVVLGNPPWERMKLQELEFFASRSEELARASSAAARKKAISELPRTNQTLWLEWAVASRWADGQSHFVRTVERYPLCGKGDVNTYALFAEHNYHIVSSTGRAGFVVPSGIVTDDTTKEYFDTLVSKHWLVSVYHFENERKVFPNVHHAFRFTLLTLGHAAVAELVFFAREIAELTESCRHFTLRPDDFLLLNPNTRTCPTFRSRRDADINVAIYRRAGVLWRDDDMSGNPWGLSFLRMFDMTNDSSLFRTRAELEASGYKLRGNRLIGDTSEYLPLIEAKMIHQFDHRFGTYEGQTEAQENQGKLPEFDDAAHADAEQLCIPYYWVKAEEVAERLRDRSSRGWLLGWRDITGTEKQRTVIASVMPRVGVGNTTPLMLPAVEPCTVTSLYANLCSLALDYTSRQKVGGTHLNYLQLKQLPVLTPAMYDVPCGWSHGTHVCGWLFPRVLELTYTAWDLAPFAHDVGYDGPPYRWDPGRRFLLRCELDAAFFHLYGLSHDDTYYVMDTFPIVRKNDEKAYGEFRTKRVILEIYDAMADAARTGKPYQTRLDPPPADPSVAHPDTRGAER